MRENEDTNSHETTVAENKSTVTKHYQRWEGDYDILKTVISRVAFAVAMYFISNTKQFDIKQYNLDDQQRKIIAHILDRTTELNQSKLITVVAYNYNKPNNTLLPEVVNFKLTKASREKYVKSILEYSKTKQKPYLPIEYNVANDNKRIRTLLVTQKVVHYKSIIY